MEIEKFIDSRTDQLREMKGGEFWPIVKCVRIRVAKAEVLRTGAVLVDLPGTRDSNAGRDTTAQEVGASAREGGREGTLCSVPRGAPALSFIAPSVLSSEKGLQGLLLLRTP